MNLRHTKPTFSYNEPANLPKPTIKDRVRIDPLLRQHAQILVNFINRSNRNLLAFRQLEMKRSSQSKSKNGKKQRSQKGKKEKYSLMTKNQTIQTLIKQSDQTDSEDKIQQQITSVKMQTETYFRQEQPKLMRDDGLFELATLRKDWDNDPKNYVLTLANMARLCMVLPKYNKVLYLMYNQNNFIQNFNPSQLGEPNQSLIYRAFSTLSTQSKKEQTK